MSRDGDKAKLISKRASLITAISTVEQQKEAESNEPKRIGDLSNPNMNGGYVDTSYPLSYIRYGNSIS